MKYLFLLLVTSFFVSGFSQDNINATLFTGTVYTSHNFEDPLPYVNVFTTNKLSANSNVDGEFSIYVASGDTLRFTHVGYQPISIIIPDSTSELNGVLYLEKDTVLLHSFSISAIPNFNEFKESFTNLKLDNRETIVARNNIALILQQGKLISSTSMMWDAQDNQRQAIQKQTNLMIYRGCLILPENMLDFVKIANGFIQIVKKKDE